MMRRQGFVSIWSREAGSVVRYNQNYGAQLIGTTEQCLRLTSLSRATELSAGVTLRK
jgi:hypothetical protein